MTMKSTLGVRDHFFSTYTTNYQRSLRLINCEKQRLGKLMKIEKMRKNLPEGHRSVVETDLNRLPTTRKVYGNGRTPLGFLELPKTPSPGHLITRSIKRNLSHRPDLKFFSIFTAILSVFTKSVFLLNVCFHFS